MKYFKLIITVLALIIFTLFFRTISADSCTDCVDQCIETHGIFYNCHLVCSPPCGVWECGNADCGFGETLASCPEDCWNCGDGICTPPRETYSSCFGDCNASYYRSCSLNEYKYNGECIPYNNSAPYQITDKDLLVNPVVFGNIKVVGGAYVELNETTNTTNLSIRKWDDTIVSSSLDIFNIISSDSDKNSFAIYLNPAITENYLETYKFFFNLVYGSGLNENKNISLPFRLFK